MKRTLLTVILVILAGSAGLIAGLLLASHAGRPSSGIKTATSAPASAQRKILYYWDPMVGPSSMSSKPGISSMGMALIPVYAPTGGAATPGEVTVDPAIVQNMGIQTARVTLGPLTKTIRAVGNLRRAAPVRYAVTLRVSGWVGKLYATTNGTAVRKGDQLFTLYSPQLLAAQQELVAAEKALRTISGQTPAPAATAANTLLTSLENRLRYLGVSTGQITTLEKTLKPKQYVTFYSPATGYLEDIRLRQKSQVTLGRRVMQIANLDRVWLDTQVYENQLPWVRLGQSISATLAAQPGRVFSGQIIFISPMEDPLTHTVTVRAVFRNRRGLLKPGMYALADIHAQPVSRVILAPRRAIIDTGTSELAFVEVSRGHFDPVTVTTGLTGKHDLVQILSGLQPGEKVLVSGQFMIDVESQLNQVAAQFTHPSAKAPQPAAIKPPATMPKGMKMN